MNFTFPNGIFNLSKSYVSVNVGNFVKVPRKPKVYGGCLDPKKMFDEIIDVMNRKNEKALERIEDFMCDCHCGCQYQCPCDEEDYCVGNHVPSYELIRESINYYYDIKDHIERIEYDKSINEGRKEIAKIEKEKQDKFDKEIEDMKKSGKYRFVTLSPKMNEKEEKERVINIMDAINFIQVKYNIK